MRSCWLFSSIMFSPRKFFSFADKSYRGRDEFTIHDPAVFRQHSAFHRRNLTEKGRDFANPRDLRSKERENDLPGNCRRSRRPHADGRRLPVRHDKGPQRLHRRAICRVLHVSLDDYFGIEPDEPQEHRNELELTQLRLEHEQQDNERKDRLIVILGSLALIFGGRCIVMDINSHAVGFYRGTWDTRPRS